MDEILLERLEAHIKENYEDPQVFFQIGSSPSKENDEKESTAAQYDYYQLELNLPPLEETFAAHLLKLIHAKGKTEVEIYKKANIDRRLFSKIRTNKDYTPSKSTILALVIALELNIDEANDLLKRAGYYLSRSKKEDGVFHFFIKNQIYDLLRFFRPLRMYGFSQEKETLQAYLSLGNGTRNIPRSIWTYVIRMPKCRMGGNTSTSNFKRIHSYIFLCLCCGTIRSSESKTENVKIVMACSFYH
ncbi:MAG: hypothetical protein IJ521_01185 [Schwartzia sp.]|nr:hypothetical protein [Schwartzia sp. (in: firmicutes)]